jgi:4,5-DOPA dioxygenase extradiol
MKRKDFLKILALMPLTNSSMNLSSLHNLASGLPDTDEMPVMFLGHGNPMNALMQNEYTQTWQTLGKKYPSPAAVLCISAHWETKGTLVTAMEKPKTIHDFGGFPKELFDYQYPAPGSPEIAAEIQKVITKTHVELDHKWGLDHGCWSVIAHLYPRADVPVLQLSLDYTRGPEWHYQLAEDLKVLRKKGVLIIGSGNIVHNLRMLNWENDKVFDWATEANDTVKNLINSGDHKSLINYNALGKSMQLAVPSPEHFLPLLYTLGMKNSNDKIAFMNDQKIDMGSIAMTSVVIGG